MVIIHLSSAIDRAGLLAGEYNIEPATVSQKQASARDADAFLMPLMQVLYKIHMQN